MTDEKKNRRSIEDITADIEQISQDTDHRDQFKALRMLAAEKGSSVVLPLPMDEHEQCERMARLMRGIGANQTQIAYKRAFPTRTSVEKTEPMVNTGHLSPADRKTIEACRGVKSLYRHFPELKRPGQPPGFPKKGSLEQKQSWCRDTAMKIILGRENEKLKAVESKDVGLGNGGPGTDSTTGLGEAEGVRDSLQETTVRPEGVGSAG
jgi:hypothetical protein